MSQIMDVTLRDGSYAIDFQFSTIDVEVIGKKLDNLGYGYIEIGPGMGMGASSLHNGLALNTDEEYLKAAQNTIKKAKYGMFCIPGIASLDDIEKCAGYGMGFIRIGTNVDKIEESAGYIKKAKECGLEVMANYMKSYVMPADKFAEQVMKSESYGADVVYLVDSSGSMFPEDIERYYNFIRKKTNIRLGLHAHNNLGLALSNSLYAVDLGFYLIETSLQGMGRSAGNTSTELFTICGMKKGILPEFNYKELLLFSRRIIYPLMKKGGVNPVDTVCGVAGFHSSYLKSIHRQAALSGVNPLELIEAYSDIDRLGLDEDKLSKVAMGLQKDKTSNMEVDFTNYFCDEQSAI